MQVQWLLMRPCSQASACVCPQVSQNLHLIWRNEEHMELGGVVHTASSHAIMMLPLTGSLYRKVSLNSHCHRDRTGAMPLSSPHCQLCAPGYVTGQRTWLPTLSLLPSITQQDMEDAEMG